MVCLSGYALLERYEIRFTMSASMTPVLGIGAISIIDKKNVTPQSR
jgi:hypothetical protein